MKVRLLSQVKLWFSGATGRERRRSRQNAPVEHFERVSEQLCCEGGTTRQIKVLMPHGMRVRFSPEPDNVSLAELVYAAASKAVPVRVMSSTLIRNIKLG